MLAGKGSGLLTRTATEKRFVVRADEKLTVFAELESAIWGSYSLTRPCTVAPQRRH
jgi:hypothetical protein